MLIRLGEYEDVSFDLKDDDRLILHVHGHEPVVAQGGADGPRLRPFLDETDYEAACRAMFHLVPFGQYGADPFPEYSRQDTFFPEPHPDHRDFDFYVKYERERDNAEREAIVTLQADLSDPIGWNVIVGVNGVTFESSIDRINRDIGSQSLRESSSTTANRPPSREDLVLSMNFLELIVDVKAAHDVVSEIRSLQIATGLDVQRRLLAWQAEKMPLRKQCVALSEAAKKRGSLIQWLPSPGSGLKVVT